MSEFEGVDIFTNAELAKRPDPYFAYLRSQGPAVRLRPDLVAVTDYATGLAIFRDDERYSTINAALGPFELPFTPEGDDITAQIEAHRDEIPYGALILNQDPPAHTRSKGVLMGIITPKRLKENEDYMVGLADRTIDEFVARGSFEVITQYSQPFATLVIADLLGVPDEDRPTFRTMVGSLPGEIGADTTNVANNPLAMIGMYFFRYIEDRRREPQKDVLTDLALQKYPDGTIPSVVDVVTAATFLFGAGQDTTVRLIAALLRFLAEDPELQQRLRKERDLIPRFVEEVLRLEGTAKGTFRLAKKRVKIGDLDVAPGTSIMLLMRSMNRDPGRFGGPEELRIDRENYFEHLSFGRGIHTCAGAPLARAEAKVTLERFFDRTTDIRIDEARHGPKGARRFDFQANYLLRGLTDLHLVFDRAR
jgi:cytochrome P450